ncbi:protein DETOXIFICATION 27-like [Magnolia sinica]|uniref:protein DETOXIFICATION 27-like n=1 Tax=Magnolia sinica TaxID=86752 RepID=UPI002658297C|nr:protein DETOXIFICATION 27-like [Magnolia sinica]
MEGGDGSVPLLEAKEGGLGKRSWMESKKLWHVAGPAVFSRICMYGTGVVTQAFAGHLGNIQLAAFSIAYTVVVGFAFGLLLGMASALETLCGQAYGAKKYQMLGIYMQRSWIIILIASIIMTPLYIFAAPVLEMIGQPREIAEQAGALSLWLLPLHFSLGFQFTLQRFLLSQRKAVIIAYVSAAVFAVHVFLSWVVIHLLDLGIVGATWVLNLSWWLSPLGLIAYTVWGGCPLTWTGFSMEAFSGLWELLKLSVASGIMLCLENWYYRILILLTGNLSNPEIAVDALSICMNINGWEMMIPFAFFAATGVRVSNELGAGNGKAAKFATIVSVATSVIIGLIFCFLILIFHDKFALIFTTSPVIIHAVDKLSILLAITILLNSIQPVLSGVAIGSGWQALVAYINVGSYYLIGVPLGVLLGWAFHLGVEGIWAGMIGGTLAQTLILMFITLRCDWDKEALSASTRVKK